MNAAVRVLLGDDHKIVREGLKMVLADDPALQVVAEADTGPGVLDEVHKLQGQLGIDVVLLDIALPGMDGLNVLQALRRDWPGLPVLMLSTYPEKQYAVRCIQLGASGYLNKSTDPDELMAALRRVAAGGMHVTPATAEAPTCKYSPADTLPLVLLAPPTCRSFATLRFPCKEASR